MSMSFLYETTCKLLASQKIDLQTALILTYFDINDDTAVFPNPDAAEEVLLEEIQKCIQIWKKNSFAGYRVIEKHTCIMTL